VILPVPAALCSYPTPQEQELLAEATTTDHVGKGEAMRIESVTMPDIQGKTPEQALKALYLHCHETAVLAMRLNNELEDLKRKVAELERNR
jgi:organic hydroperoxide reductase OsmC/OhrA